MVLQGVSAVTINLKQTGYSIIMPGSSFTQPLPKASPKSMRHFAAHTTTVAVPAVLDGWLERYNPWERAHKDTLMVYVASLPLYRIMYSTASSSLYCEPSLCFDGRWNKWDAFEGKQAYGGLFYIWTRQLVRYECLRYLTMFEDKVMHCVVVRCVYFKNQSKWRRAKYQSRASFPS